MASGRDGCDAVLIQRGADFSVASGRPVAEQIESGKPFFILLPEDEELPSESTATDAAVRAAYKANNVVQAAIEHDVCSNGDDMIDNEDAMSRLSDANRASYVAVRGELDKAYAASAGTDSALQDVRRTTANSSENVEMESGEIFELQNALQKENEFVRETIVTFGRQLDRMSRDVQRLSQDMLDVRGDIGLLESKNVSRHTEIIEILCRLDERS